MRIASVSILALKWQFSGAVLIWRDGHEDGDRVHVLDYAGPMGVSVAVRGAAAAVGLPDLAVAPMTGV